MATLEEKFKKAVNFIQALPNDGPYSPGMQEKLQFYSLFKQATVGPCNAKKPGMFDVIAKTKWEAWNKLGKLTKEKAMEKYLKLFTTVASKLNTPEAKQILAELGEGKIAAKL